LLAVAAAAAAAVVGIITEVAAQVVEPQLKLCLD
jgi:hypothetical protein